LFDIFYFPNGKSWESTTWGIYGIFCRFFLMFFWGVPQNSNPKEAKVLEESGETKAFQLLLKETSPKLDAMLGELRELDPSNTHALDFTVVAQDGSVSAELRKRCEEARRKKEEMAKRNSGWLEERKTASVERKQQKREEDLQDYHCALEDLIAQLAGDALQVCRHQATKGLSEAMFDFQHAFQQHELGAMIFFKRKAEYLRESSIWRGWYFSVHDGLDPNEGIQMGGDYFYRFIITCRDLLVPHLTQLGLQVTNNNQLIHAIEIRWPEP
jgi:hypothetical protein